MSKAENRRLAESQLRQKHWKRWGPYLSERAWGTVREDYSPHGTAWDYLPHELARSKAYRWGEDGLAGLCDNHQRLCLGLGLWNGRDAILKERLFGLTGNEGNHGEDVKECYFYLDSTPTHAYMKYLYKYPQQAFPYQELIDANRGRSRSDPEFELIDTGVFDRGRYFDVFVEYAKVAVDDIAVRITAWNRGPEAAGLSAPAAQVQRQALAGLLWTKQFYFYEVDRWLKEDEQGRPFSGRVQPRNTGWRHLYNEDVISMPDKWEYPWYASWDLAFHCVPLALVDPDFAKEQLILFLREWYMHPNGQVPAYEWAFDDVNPPVHAWAVWRVYKIEKRLRGRADRDFLEKAFHKLLLNFTWWVNRKDAAGKNIFQGGFLGLDNIGIFDRSAPLPMGGTIEQSDATSWMGMFCLNMLAIALELARIDQSYSDIASKFFEHFVYISHAINHLGDENLQLWDEEDGFFYDALTLPDGTSQLMKVRSMVGLIALFAVETLEPEVVRGVSGFRKRMTWFIENRPHLQEHICCRRRSGERQQRLLAIVGRDRLRRVLRPMLDEREFLSPYGIRSLSRYHAEHPYTLKVEDQAYQVDYQPAESVAGIFGGNSNWRGPVWFPLNFLLIESLQKFHYYYGDNYKVECPTGSGCMLSLWEVATELIGRLAHVDLARARAAVRLSYML